VDQFGNLHLHDLKLDDSDSYVCSLDNNGNVTQVQTLRVIAEPSILKLPQSVASPSSQTARFECLAEGYPPPVVRWFRDGSPVSLTGRISVKGEDQTLVISQSTSSDSGIYQCLVENEAGSATAAARLLISAANDQPRPPRIIQIQPISSTSVKLQLEPDDSETSSSIKAYSIHYMYPGGKELQQVSQNTTAVIDSLMPFTNYTFYARAYGNSASEPSAMSFVETKDDVPLRSPKIQLTAISPTSVRVSWSPLPPAQARGQVTKYEIHYKKRSQTAYHVTDVPDGKIESFVLEDLQPSHRYDVRVLAGTSAGFPKVSDGPLWPWTSIEMPAIDDHILSSNFTDAEPESSSITPSLVSVTTTRVPGKADRIGISVIHLLVWIMAGSVISASLVCLCILTLHCRNK
jgi:netrin-G3 ligand